MWNTCTSSHIYLPIGFRFQISLLAHYLYWRRREKKKLLHFFFFAQNKMWTRPAPSFTYIPYIYTDNCSACSCFDLIIGSINIRRGYFICFLHDIFMCTFAYIYICRRIHAAKRANLFNFFFIVNRLLAPVRKTFLCEWICVLNECVYARHVHAFISSYFVHIKVRERYADAYASLHRRLIAARSSPAAHSSIASAFDHK